VIKNSELVLYVGESVVANTSYGISMHVQRKSIEILIQDSVFMIEIGMNLLCMLNAFYNVTFGVVEDRYVR
jgi:hypothetical protein